MVNLIVTIIGILLFAISIVAVFFYGGAAYQQGQINAIADSIINESQQILNAERLWASNNNQPDVSGMPNPSTGNSGTTYLVGSSGGAGTGISALVNGKMLVSWPPLAGPIGGPTYTLPASFPGAGPAPASSGNVATSAYDSGCYSFNGYTGAIRRILFAYNGGNYVDYEFGINVAKAAGSCATLNGVFTSGTTDASQANHPIVLIAKAINTAINRIPSNAYMGLMPYIGLPQVPIGSAWQAPPVFNAYTTSGVLQANYCYVNGSAGYNLISCVFGPS